MITRCKRLFTLAIVLPVLLLAVQAQASVITTIDNFDAGTLNLATTNTPPSNSLESTGIVQSSLPTSSVLGGVRIAEMTVFGTSPSTITNPSGVGLITLPTGPGFTTTNPTFTYNAGQFSLPSPGIALDLSQLVAFHVDIFSPVAIPNVQLQISTSLAVTKFANAGVPANTPTTLTFLPSDFTGGGVFPVIQKVSLALQGISSSNLILGANVVTIDNFVVETIPEPTSIAMLAAGSLVLLLRRQVFTA